MCLCSPCCDAEMDFEDRSKRNYSSDRGRHRKKSIAMSGLHQE